MALAVGARLGPYEILTPLGAGGMGEVYKARDTRLSREVAIKVLPSHLSKHSEVRARFEHEARAVSSLSHPHICALYDVGRHEDLDYLVMELIEGETVAERLKSGPMPVPDLLRCALQIADAMDRAHRQGLLHRDLKPGNIMLTKAGAKLLDFGLAKSIGSASAPSELTASPTMTSPLTAQGTIVGTFQYMAPEQLEGKEADARSDIFAFGAVLYEMATGRRAFEGKTQASLIASILKEAPRSFAETAPMTPPALERLVRTCLEKNPDDRRQTMRGVLLDLKWIAEGGGRSDVTVPPLPRRGALRERIFLAASVVFLVASLLLGWRLIARAPAEAPTVRLSLTDPLPSRGAPFGMVEISPDGRSLAFPGEGSEGKVELWVRDLGSLSARRLPGTEDASLPFWSPDGGSIAFFAEGKLKRVPAAGGPPQTICDAPSPAGGSWSPTGTIIFAGVGIGGLAQVSPGGGAPTPLTHVGPREEGHIWPHFLPDGRHFAFLVDAVRREDHFLSVASLDAPQGVNLFNAVTNVAFAPPDLLIYVRSRTLLAQRIDPATGKPAGDPIPVAENVVQDTEPHHFAFSVSKSGALAYRSADLDTRLTWVTREGKPIEAIGEVGRYRGISLSPNGRLLGFEKLDADNRVGDLWAYDLSRGAASRITFRSGSEQSPAWSPDSREVAYVSGRAGASGIYRTDLSKSGTEKLILAGDGEDRPTSWSPDGRLLLYERQKQETRSDIGVVPADGSGKGELILHSPFSEQAGLFSPDGRWIAYVSDESGRQEVYAQAFPGGSPRVQISAGGGSHPRWRADGKEIYFVTSKGRLTAVDLRRAGADLEVGDAHGLFDLPGAAYDPSTDGQRFIVDLGAQNPLTAPYTIVLNWVRDPAKR